MSDEDDDQELEVTFGLRAKHVLVPLILGGGTGGTSIALKLFESEYASVGLGAAAAISVYMRFSGLPPLRRLLKSSPTQTFDPDSYFSERRDAEVEERNDASVYVDYRELMAAAFRAWVNGDYRDPVKYQEAKDAVLNAILYAEALRLNHVCKRPITLAIVEDTGAEYRARRCSPGGLGSKIRRGIHCAHDGSLDRVLRKYADFSHKAEFQASGQNYYLVALSDAAFSATAIALIEDAATQYHSSYQLLRLIAATSPPPITTLPPPGTSSSRALPPPPNTEG